MSINFNEQITAVFNAEELESIQQAINKICKLQAESKKPFLSLVEFQSLCKSIGEGVSPYNFINNDEEQSYLFAECAILELETLYSQYCSKLTQAELALGNPSSIKVANDKKLAEENAKALSELRAKEAQERLEAANTENDKIDKLVFDILNHFLDPKTDIVDQTYHKKLLVLIEACGVSDESNEEIKARVLKKLGKANRIKYGFDEKQNKVASVYEAEKIRYTEKVIIPKEFYTEVFDWIEGNSDKIVEYVYDLVKCRSQYSNGLNNGGFENIFGIKAAQFLSELNSFNVNMDLSQLNISDYLAMYPQVFAMAILPSNNPNPETGSFIGKDRQIRLQTPKEVLFKEKTLILGLRAKLFDADNNLLPIIPND